MMLKMLPNMFAAHALNNHVSELFVATRTRPSTHLRYELGMHVFTHSTSRGHRKRGVSACIEAASAAPDRDSHVRRTWAPPGR